MSHLSRGSSHVWVTHFTSNFRSAWDKSGPNSVRIVMANGRIVGALLMGSQELADPLRQLIEHEVDLSTHHSTLLDGNDQLPHAILKAWSDWHQSW